MPDLGRLGAATIRRGTKFGIVTACLAALTLSFACSDDDQSPSLTVTSTAGAPSASPSPTSIAGAPSTAVFTTSTGDTVALSIEVADTPEERAVGLMNRESMPEDSGMLFDFQEEVQAAFWMKNTLLPLSIAFIDKSGVIVHIEDMEPQTEDLHYSPSLYRYAIEAKQGWYEENGIVVGDTVELNAG